MNNLPRVCILTDSTAQFPTRSFPGQDLVNVLPIAVSLPEEPELEAEEIKAVHLPASLMTSAPPQVQMPDVDQITTAFEYLGSRFDQIAAVFLSKHLCPIVPQAILAAERLSGRMQIEVIDSRTTSVGLGLLVQLATAAAAQGQDLKEIKRILLGAMPHIYSVFCVNGLTYLHHSGFLDRAQAVVGERLSVMPFYVLEKGHLIPSQKIRNSRHMVDCLHEFVTEFAALHHIALLQGVPAYEQESRAFRERIKEDYPEVSISEHTITPALAAVLGPRTLGMFLWEIEEE